jgi:hypothetical protein
MIKLPGLPNPDKALSFLDTASGLIDRGLSVIDKVSNKLDKFGLTESPQKEAPESPGAAITTTGALKTAPGASSEAPETPHTLEYQLDLLLDDLSHLETEHLPAKGRLLGRPCDCIAKASRSLRRHARETIPIAGREGKDTTLFDALAQEGDYLMGVGTLEAVKSGKYDSEYLSHAGIISNFRKSVDKMLAEVKSGPDCPECEELRQLSRSISERRKGFDEHKGQRET